jgi:hypothetical protein
MLNELFFNRLETARICEENVKLDFKEMRGSWKSMDWIHLARDRDQRRALVDVG